MTPSLGLKTGNSSAQLCSHARAAFLDRNVGLGRQSRVAARQPELARSPSTVGLNRTTQRLFQPIKTSAVSPPP